MCVSVSVFICQHDNVKYIKRINTKFGGLMDIAQGPIDYILGNFGLKLDEKVAKTLSCFTRQSLAVVIACVQYCYSCD